MQPDSGTHQFSTFYLGDRLYGIDVMQVQEVTRPLALTEVRLAPSYVKGLINLRGQIATAIGLRELFGLTASEPQERMTVVCRSEGNLFSFLVDRIGDVIEVPESSFEPAPETLDPAIREFMVGVYKTDGPILSVIGVDKIFSKLNETANFSSQPTLTDRKGN